MKYLATSVLVFLLVTACKKGSASPTNNSTTPPTPVTSIGANYAGGIVFYLSEDGQHGMVVSDHNVDSCRWSLNNDYINVGWQVGKGKANTDSIVASQGAGHYAAKTCQDLVLNGYDDWYLPSSWEFKEILSSQALGAYTSLNPNEGYYWTSSGSTVNGYASAARLTNAVDPSIVDITRVTWYRVRAVRSF